MRHLIILLTSAALLVSPTVGRAQSLLTDAVDVGGFVALDADIGHVNGGSAVLSGAEIGMLLNHRFSLGLTGAGLVSDDDSPSPTSDLRRFGYGGISLGYVVAPASTLHYLADILVAGGSVRPEPDLAADAEGDGDRLFVVRPSIAAEVNISRHVRATAGISYRAVSGVDTAGLSNADLSGFAIRLVIKAGRF